MVMSIVSRKADVKNGRRYRVSFQGPPPKQFLGERIHVDARSIIIVAGVLVELHCTNDTNGPTGSKSFDWPQTFLIARVVGSDSFRFHTRVEMLFILAATGSVAGPFTSTNR